MPDWSLELSNQHQTQCCSHIHFTSFTMSKFQQNQSSNRVSYGQVQYLLSLYQKALKQSPVFTKSVTSGIIACTGSIISQVRQLRLVFETSIFIFRNIYLVCEKWTGVEEHIWSFSCFWGCCYRFNIAFKDLFLKDFLSLRSPYPLLLHHPG